MEIIASDTDATLARIQAAREARHERMMDASTLPETPQNTADWQRWLVSTRRSHP